MKGFHISNGILRIDLKTETCANCNKCEVVHQYFERALAPHIRSGGLKEVFIHVDDTDPRCREQNKKLIEFFSGILSQLSLPAPQIVQSPTHTVAISI